LRQLSRFGIHIREKFQIEIETAMLGQEFFRALTLADSSPIMPA